MKKFLITIDTEGDNLWEWKRNEPITTKNVYYLERFQKLCNKYGFKPVWLTNYEMICNDDYVEFVKKIVDDKNGELGIHLHAWNTPPAFELKTCNNAPSYLIEYPEKIMNDKFVYLYNLIVEKTGIKPVTHRAGRWAMNECYFSILKKYDINVDCSFTPYIDWKKSYGETKNSVGPNYKHIRNKIYNNYNVYELPTTIIKKHFIKLPLNSFKNIIKMVYFLIFGKKMWLRPTGKNLEEMIYIINKMKKCKKINYVMFMLHSSELMPGGSPYFKNEEEIEKLYKDLDCLFAEASRNYVGSTIDSYWKEFLNVKN